MTGLANPQSEFDSLGLGPGAEQRQAAHAILGDALAGNVEGRLIGRVARVEGDVARQFAAGTPYTRRIRAKASLNAGISPPMAAVLDDFSQRYLNAMRAADLMTLPFYTDRLERLAEARNYVPAATPWFSYDVLRHPFGQDDPETHWIRGLDGRRVLVVSSMRRSIEQQLDRLDKVYAKAPALRPNWASVTVVDAPLTQWNSEALDSPEPDRTWSEHFADLTEEIARHADSFDVCLISCGGYGMPVAHFVKTELDRIALMYGGALQLVFGINGKRWDRREPVSQWMTDDWIRPDPTERPDVWQEIERGAYW